ncbi:MAG: DoxX family protein [Deltaproteobacteria bacterium]|jgi:putative oxidoreductase|nr:DoxX family protein [Deltaproteobacteria bacterium]MBT4644039.1 DoxX family protein [Deltaproteobacteria bacterium]MBT6503662.1 DoxX family protein [Deltaproteobacteria bacterium]MBT7152683.1 DoxX family protein [Deltaproteobacteria bacterium]MBT7713497.1 DoxX family protein [Deltaproteobacteria bacterium]
MNTSLKKLVGTEADISGLVMRLALGVVMFSHGAGKLFGWFGGFGFSGTMSYFTGNGMPWLIAFLVVMAESLGALALIVGFFGRFMSFGIFMVMLGAIFMVHAKFGFFMNWMGKQAGEGYEYHILALGLALALMIKGSGALSFDLFLSRRLQDD